MAEDLAGLDDFLRKLQERLEDPAPFLHGIGRHLENVAERSFETLSTPSGTPWKPLSPLTIAVRKSLGYPAGPPLTMSGRLRLSITREVDVAAGEVTVGSDVPYADLHQRGAGRRYPQRRFLGFAGYTGDAIRDALDAHLSGQDIPA